MRAPCATCPFWEHSKMLYDSDGLLALEDGYAPTCHMHTRMNIIFEDPHPGDSTRCVGYDRWLDGADGFIKPRTEIDAQAALKY